MTTLLLWTAKKVVAFGFKIIIDSSILVGKGNVQFIQEFK